MLVDMREPGPQPASPIFLACMLKMVPAALGPGYLSITGLYFEFKQFQPRKSTV